MYYATLFYDSILLWLFIIVGSQKLSDSHMSATTVIIIFVTAIFLSGLNIIYQMYQRSDFVAKLDAAHLGKLSAEMYELYFFRLYQLITSPSPADKTLLWGIMLQHLDTCPSNSFKTLGR